MQEYCGCGEAGEAAAAQDRKKREERDRIRLAQNAEDQRIRSIEVSTDAFCALVNSAVREALNVSGYHQHKRGEWRKKRNGRH